MILKGRTNERMHTKAIILIISMIYEGSVKNYENDLRRKMTMITMITVILIMTIIAKALTTMNTKAVIMIIALITKTVGG